MNQQDKVDLFCSFFSEALLDFSFQGEGEHWGKQSLRKGTLPVTTLPEAQERARSETFEEWVQGLAF